MINAISIQGFKSFQNLVRIEFKQCINILKGQNGSGKSSVIEALRYGLGFHYGTLSAEKRKFLLAESSSVNFSEHYLRISVELHPVHLSFEHAKTLQSEDFGLSHLVSYLETFSKLSSKKPLRVSENQKKLNLFDNTSSKLNNSDNSTKISAFLSQPSPLILTREVTKDHDVLLSNDVVLSPSKAFFLLSILRLGQFSDQTSIVTQMSIQRWTQFSPAVLYGAIGNFIGITALEKQNAALKGLIGDIANKETPRLLEARRYLEAERGKLEKEKGELKVLRELEKDKKTIEAHYALEKSEKVRLSSQEIEEVYRTLKKSLGRIQQEKNEVGQKIMEVKREIKKSKASEEDFSHCWAESVEVSNLTFRNSHDSEEYKENSLGPLKKIFEKSELLFSFLQKADKEIFPLLLESEIAGRRNGLAEGILSDLQRMAKDSAKGKAKAMDKNKIGTGIENLLKKASENLRTLESSENRKAKKELQIKVNNLLESLKGFNLGSKVEKGAKNVLNPDVSFSEAQSSPDRIIERAKKERRSLWTKLREAKEEKEGLLYDHKRTRQSSYKTGSYHNVLILQFARSLAKKHPFSDGRSNLCIYGPIIDLVNVRKKYTLPIFQSNKKAFFTILVQNRASLDLALQELKAFNANSQFKISPRFFILEFLLSNNSTKPKKPKRKETDSVLEFLEGDAPVDIFDCLSVSSQFIPSGLVPSDSNYSETQQAFIRSIFKPVYILKSLRSSVVKSIVANSSPSFFIDRNGFSFYKGQFCGGFIEGDFLNIDEKALAEEEQIRNCSEYIEALGKDIEKKEKEIGDLIKEKGRAASGDTKSSRRAAPGKEAKNRFGVDSCEETFLEVKCSLEELLLYLEKINAAKVKEESLREQIMFLREVLMSLKECEAKSSGEFSSKLFLEKIVARIDKFKGQGEGILKSLEQVIKPVLKKLNLIQNNSRNSIKNFSELFTILKKMLASFSEKISFINFSDPSRNKPKNANSLEASNSKILKSLNITEKSANHQSFLETTLREKSEKTKQNKGLRHDLNRRLFELEQKAKSTRIRLENCLRERVRLSGHMHKYDQVLEEYREKKIALGREVNPNKMSEEIEKDFEKLVQRLSTNDSKKTENRRKKGSLKKQESHKSYMKIVEERIEQERRKTNRKAEAYYEKFSSKLEGVLSNVEIAKRLQEKLGECVDLIDRIKGNKMKEVLEKVQVEFRKIVNELSEGLQAELEVGDNSLKFNKQNWSGGQRALLGIALVISLVRVLKIPFVAFDEADASLDRAKVFRFVDAIVKEKDAGVQVLVCSFKDPVLEIQEEKNIIEIKKEGGISKIVE